MPYEFNIADAVNVIRDLVGPDRIKARRLQREGMEGQNALLGAQTAQAQATTERINQLTPAEVAQLVAQTGLTGAQTGLTSAQTGFTGAQTGLVKEQTSAVQGGERRANAKLPYELQSNMLDNLIKGYTAESMPDLTAAQIESLLGGAAQSRGQGAYYQTQANLSPDRLSLERNELAQRGKLGEAEISGREFGNLVQLYDAATRVYPQNQNLLNFIQTRLGYTPPEQAGPEGESDAEKLRKKLLGLGTEEGKKPLSYESAGPFTPGLFNGGMSPGNQTVSSGIANALYSGFGSGGPKTARPAAKKPAAKKPYVDPKTVPAGQGPSAEGAMGDKTLVQLLQAIRNILANAGVKR